MANLKALSSLRTGALRLVDVENAGNRFPNSEVNIYINQAIRHVYAEMLEVMDRPFFISEATISCLPPPFGQTAIYPLPSNFLQILSVAWADNPSSGPFLPLQPYEEADRTLLLNAGFYGGLGPQHYGITGAPGGFTQGTIPTAYAIEVLPSPTNNSVLKLRYVPEPPELVNDTDTLDGMLGNEDAVMTWAAILIRRKDQLDTSELERDMVKHIDRIRRVSKRRDRSRPPKVSLVRRSAAMGGRRGGRGWGSI